MTESDAGHITTTYTGKPKPDAEHQADLNKLRSQLLDGVLLRAFPDKATKTAKRERTSETRGRKRTESILTLEAVLRLVERNMPPEGGTLREWLERIKGRGALYTVPKTARQVEYLDALDDYGENFRSRFRRILGKKLLPQPRGKFRPK